MNWNEYQHIIAGFFRSIGATAETDATVRGVRGTHKVDVLVKLRHLGIDVVWIIECKLWKTSIPKEKVLALQQIVQDVGADRGLLLSESGFQAGSIKSANLSNITLSSLSELEEVSKEELSKLKLKYISLKLQQLTDRYHTFIPWDSFTLIKPEHLIEYLFPSLFTIRTELFKAHNSNFPIKLFSVTVLSIPEFIDACEEIFDKAEIGIKNIECEYNVNIETGLQLFAHLKLLISKLQYASEDIVVNIGNPAKKNEIRIYSVDVMKEIGELMLQLRSYTNNTSYPVFRLIHKILMDELYLDLINENLDEQYIQRTNNNLVKAYSRFEEVFQPISIPPAPDTSI
jgi:restriction endonuclease